MKLESNSKEISGECNALLRCLERFRSRWRFTLISVVPREKAVMAVVRTMGFNQINRLWVTVVRMMGFTKFGGNVRLWVAMVRMMGIQPNSSFLSLHKSAVGGGGPNHDQELNNK